ncbi:nicotinate-nucleotide pyrophosphorylase [Candidatus Photodesmus katoptron]|uniref:nicotinate-nucleotide diphosphorylase (carboxylating) n=1 Tax=Candidatus Photodesmus katoptron Akat1 TaxID=1236703 RepID=S3DL53_9GAMM|nr:carboxylating nicotinate-nucleotide diphosphorylase [Candidatus Photodesmus katoptron]EPE37869.1 nicotinate-nucleotide diphosphorylase [Candidatus Photodesmus katoptron Akat1]KEY90412.1 nicotinate-nucleotide pyrophosphorylase [Candidatus Photodesmus katoptron]
MKKTHNIRERLNYLKQILPTEITRTVAHSLTEDLGGSIYLSSDITSNLISEGTHGKAIIISREKGVFCGRDWVDEVFTQLSSHENKLNKKVKIEWYVKDGDKIKVNQILCRLSGSARTILTGERNAINFIQTFSGCATTTYQYIKKIANTKCCLLDTRKTIPGLRYALKYAVVCGGGKNHRIGLFDDYLIKENHIISCGGIVHAISKAKKLHPQKTIQIEIENLKELEQAINSGADVIMLDNFDIDMIRRAVQINADRTILECSGNITLENIKEYANTGIDYISIGSLTKDLKTLDLSMRFQ